MQEREYGCFSTNALNTWEEVLLLEVGEHGSERGKGDANGAELCCHRVGDELLTSQGLGQDILSFG